MNYARLHLPKNNEFYVDLGAALCSLLVFIAYYEYFGTNGWFFYLTNTPPQLILIPSLLLVLYRYFGKKPYFLTLSISLLFFIFTFLIAGRTPLILNTKADTNQTVPLRICSWNSEFFFENAHDTGFSKLRDEHCNVVLLQEVWQSSEMLNEIKQYQQHYLPAHTVKAYGEFVAMIPTGYNIDVITSQNGGFFGINLVQETKKLTIMSIHLWNPITDKPVLQDGKLTKIKANDARTIQKREILSKLSSLNADSSSRVVVMGDFNTMQNGEIIRKISTIGSRDNKLTILSLPLWKNRNTYSISRRIIDIDHAFVSRQLFGNTKYQTISNSKASDHCLLIADILL